MATKTYAEKLLDPRWQKKRLEVFSRDSFMCQECGAEGKTLHLHHKYYLRDKEPWEYDNSFLVTLCCDCHKKVPLEIKQYEETILSNYRTRIEDSFVLRCVADVFSEYRDLHGLMYLLWELKDKQDDVLNTLQSMFSEQYNSFIKHITSKECQESEA